jgi:DNA (cytosine-5)-methyltransferase 1
MKVLDLFSGCGGLSLGFEQAGFEIYGGVDNNSHAIATFQHNFPNSIALEADLELFDTANIAIHFPEYYSVDVLIGGPPCQGFSSANRWTHETDSKRNRLFFEFVEFVELINPMAVVIENVRGIVTRDNGYAKNRIYEIFNGLGYKVNHCVLNASDYGVPQKRFRNFFVMTKKELFDFDTMEKSTDIPTVGEALMELYQLENSQYNDSYQLKTDPQTNFQKYLRAANNVVRNHETRYPADIVQKRISHVPQGGNWRAVPEDMWPTQRSNRHSSAYRRLHEDRPSVTIDTGNTHSNYFHPVFNRLPSPREAARLQSFPDEFFFTGTRTPQYIQVGNAVPPLLAKSLAVALRKVL